MWLKGFPGAEVVKNPLSIQEMKEIRVQSLGQENPPEKEMATCSSILVWKISWTEEPGGLQFTGVAESDVTEREHTHSLKSATW